MEFKENKIHKHKNSITALPDTLEAFMDMEDSESKGIESLTSHVSVLSKADSILHSDTDEDGNADDKINTEAEKSWWMDQEEYELQDSDVVKNTQNWLKQENNSFLTEGPSALLDATEVNKQKFFQALQEAGIEPNFSVHEDDKSIEENKNSILYENTSFDSFYSEKREYKLNDFGDDLNDHDVVDSVVHMDPINPTEITEITEKQTTKESIDLDSHYDKPTKDKEIKNSILKELETSYIVDTCLSETNKEINLTEVDKIPQDFEVANSLTRNQSNPLNEEAKSMTRLLDDVLQEVHPSFVNTSNVNPSNTIPSVTLQESQQEEEMSQSITEIQDKFGDILDESSLNLSMTQDDSNQVSLNQTEQPKQLVPQVMQEEETKSDMDKPDKVSLLPIKSLVSVKKKSPIKPLLKKKQEVETRQEIQVAKTNSLNLESQLQDEIYNLNQTIANLVQELESIRLNLDTKEKETESLRQDVVLLESILEKEQENSRLLISKPVPSSNNQKEKEVLELERLLSGYQVENEKLVNQVKEMKKQVVEAEKKEIQNLEKLNRQVSLLKSQLEEKTQLQVDPLPYQTKIESLEAEKEHVLDLLNEKERNWTSRNKKLQQELNELKESMKVKESMKIEKDLEETPESNKENKETQDQLLAKISELESKLEWYNENQELLQEYQTIIQQKDAMIQDLNSSLEKREAQSQSRRGKRSIVDEQKMKELETQIKILKQQQQNSLSSSSKNKMENKKEDKSLKEESLKTTIQELQNQVSTLTLESSNSLSEIQLRSLHQEFNHVKSGYEKRILELENELQTTKAQDCREDTDERMIDLKQQLKNALQLAATSNDSLNDSHSIQNSSQKRRILELEKLVDEQSYRLDAILNDKSGLESQLLSRIKEKDALIESYETRIFELQSAFKDKIFLVNESKNIEETNRLFLELETAQREIASLKNQLEISEETRKSVHVTTLSILKSAQEESAKIALSHHQQSMSALLNELRQESLKYSRNQQDSQLIELKNGLEKSQQTILEYQVRIQEYEARESVLNQELIELKQSLERVLLENQEIKKGWPHSMKLLESKLKSLEDSATKREMEINSLIQFSREDAAQTFEQERQDYARMLKKKDEEIISFKKELESMIASVLELKNHSSLSMF